jgi:hypothetical protein
MGEGNECEAQDQARDEGVGVSVIRHFEFKGDPVLAEHSADLRLEAKRVRGGGGQRHKQADLAALGANGAQQFGVRFSQAYRAQTQSPCEIPGDGYGYMLLRDGELERFRKWWIAEPGCGIEGGQPVGFAVNRSRDEATL